MAIKEEEEEERRYAAYYGSVVSKPVGKDGRNFLFASCYVSCGKDTDLR